MNKEQAKCRVDDRVPIIGSRYVKIAEYKREQFEIVLKAGGREMTEQERAAVRTYSELIEGERKEIQECVAEIHSYIDQIRWWKLF